MVSVSRPCASSCAWLTGNRTSRRRRPRSVPKHSAAISAHATSTRRARAIATPAGRATAAASAATRDTARRRAQDDRDRGRALPGCASGRRFRAILVSMPPVAATNAAKTASQRRRARSSRRAAAGGASFVPLAVPARWPVRAHDIARVYTRRRVAPGLILNASWSCGPFSSLAMLWPASAAGQTRSRPIRRLRSSSDSSRRRPPGAPTPSSRSAPRPRPSGLRMFAALTAPPPTRFVIKERDRAPLEPAGERLLLEVFGEHGIEATITTWRAERRRRRPADGTRAASPRSRSSRSSADCTGSRSIRRSSSTCTTSPSRRPI